MPRENSDCRTGLLLSGGVDSSILLDRLVTSGAQVVPFYIRTGTRWEMAEFAALCRFMAAIDRNLVGQLVVFDVPLADLYGSHWSVSGDNVPDDASADAAVYMPGRNPLLLVKPVMWCQMHAVEQLALATLASNPFDDATPEFFRAFEEMMQRATRAHVQIIRPFERLSKADVMRLGEHLPLELTFSCLNPVGSEHCGRCNKCAERRTAFRRAELVDRTTYHNAKPAR